ncbi:MAG: DUF488 family protein [Nitrososphaerales archaeon]
MKIFSIGHSTRPSQEFIDLLRMHHIDRIIDVRKYPTSKRFPQFDQRNLSEDLKSNQIDYVHIPELGGFREEGYLAFSKSEEFEAAFSVLIKEIENRNACIMCSERLFYRCHRRQIAERLVTLGHTVFHILDQSTVTQHKPEMPEMQLKLFCDKVEKPKSA